MKSQTPTTKCALEVHLIHWVSPQGNGFFLQIVEQKPKYIDFWDGSGWHLLSKSRPGLDLKQHAFWLRGSERDADYDRLWFGIDHLNEIVQLMEAVENFNAYYRTNY